MGKEKAKVFFTGAVVGGVLGAVTALLLAPKSGKELRSDITEQAKVVGEKTQDIISSVSTHTSEWVEKAKDTGSNMLHEIRSWRQGDKDPEKELEEVAVISKLYDYEEIEEEFLQEAENI